jgi:hypothetical protein
VEVVEVDLWIYRKMKKVIIIFENEKSIFPFPERSLKALLPPQIFVRLRPKQPPLQPIKAVMINAIKVSFIPFLSQKPSIFQAN